MKVLLLLVFGLFACVSLALCQEPNSVEPTLISIPKAKYPKIAKNADVEGKIGVKVTVDPSGTVINAMIDYGPGEVCESVSTAPVVALRNSALEAARKSKFTPAIHLGKPVESSTILNIEFKKSSKELGNSIEDSFKSDTARQAAPKELPKTLGRGIIDSFPIGAALPKPSYPAAARAVRASGTVPVRVLVLEDGTVYSAKANGGHPLLQRAAEIAACKARFVPTLLSGEPIRITGIINYNFVP